MTYSVTWKLTPIEQLNRVEIAAVDPQAIRQASARIDFALRRYPNDMGESRSPGFRLWYEDVLGVYYKIDDSALTVEVMFAGLSRRRK